MRWDSLGIQIQTFQLKAIQYCGIGNYFTLFPSLWKDTCLSCCRLLLSPDLDVAQSEPGNQEVVHSPGQRQHISGVEGVLEIEILPRRHCVQVGSCLLGGDSEARVGEAGSFIHAHEYIISNQTQGPAMSFGLDRAAES